MVRARSSQRSWVTAIAVQRGVDSSVSAAVEAVTAGFAVAFGGRSRERRGAVEAGEAALAGETAGIADLDEQFGVGTFGDAAQLLEGGAGGAGEPAELAAGLTFAGAAVGDGGGVIVEKPQPQRARPVNPSGVVSTGQRPQPSSHVFGVGQLVAQGIDRKSVV